MVIKGISAIFSLMALASALGVVISRNAVHSAINLVAVMVSLAGLFLLMGAELVAAIQIIVYAGAIVVLFLFVIMMLNLREPETPPARLQIIRIVAVLFGLSLLSQLGAIAYGVYYSSKASTARVSGDEGLPPPNPGLQPATPTEEPSATFNHLAGALMTDFALPFELTSILLLVAILGAIVLARRRPAPGEDGPGIESPAGIEEGGTPR